MPIFLVDNQPSVDLDLKRLELWALQFNLLVFILPIYLIFIWIPILKNNQILLDLILGPCFI